MGFLNRGRLGSRFLKRMDLPLAVEGDQQIRNGRKKANMADFMKEICFTSYIHMLVHDAHVKYSIYIALFMVATKGPRFIGEWYSPNSTQIWYSFTTPSE